MTDTSRILQLEIEAARTLLDGLKAMVGEDEQALYDTFEGETTLDGAIRKTLLANFEDEMCIEGIKVIAEKLKARKERAEKRIEVRRGLIEQAMVLANWKKKQFDIATVSVGKAAARVEIEDESEIPTQFWKRADPKLDKAGLGAVLKERDKALTAAEAIKDPKAREQALKRVDEEHPAIPGAHLETGGVTLTISRR
jgi:Siphovirus Gp157